MSEEAKNPEIVTEETNFLPVLPLKNVVALPKSIVPVIVGRDISIKAIEYALENKKEIFVTAQRDAETQNPGLEDVYEIGTRAILLQASRLPNGTLKILIEGIARCSITSFQQREDFLGVLAEDLPVEKLDHTPENEALWRTLYGLFKDYSELSDKVPRDIITMFKGLEDLDYLADTIAVHIQLKLDERQEILEMVDLEMRARHIIKLLENEIEIIKTEQKIRKRVQSQVEKHQKDYYLYEQMRAIQRELGKDDQMQEIEELRDRAKKAKLSKEAMEKVEIELKRLEQMQPSSPEASVGRNYVEWMLALPWHKQSKDTVGLKQAQKILDTSHAGMKKAKERIVEFIATKKFAKSKLKRSPIICLAGPPGVGKTSIARSVAKSLGREFVRMSLGGLRDEAEIRGHRRTYIGAMPGKIIQAMRKAKTTNPVILLDEIDKMSMDFRGDPASAMLEVLDPEHNNAFTDHFLDVEYDLSRAMFITTANVVDNIPYPLLDRMEIIQISGYTVAEKLQIGRDFLLPKLNTEHALTTKKVKIDDAILRTVVEEYTKEAGVRQLERVLSKLIRKGIEELLADKKKKTVIVTEKKVRSWLGPAKFKVAERKIEENVGVATGLAWTEIGGDVLEVEVSIMKGKGSLSMTGQLGEVMQESAQAALSYVRSRAKDLGLKETFYSDIDIHIHVPEGAIPKDGPSAGITMTSALVSALTKVPLKKGVAMTGEVTLRGRVLGVGGLKEKLLAAIRHNATSVIVPKENEDEINEFKHELDSSLQIMYAEDMDRVIAEALVTSPFKGRVKKQARSVVPAQRGRRATATKK